MKNQVLDKINRWKGTFLLVCADILVTFLSGGLAILARFEMRFNSIPDIYLSEWYRFIPVQIVIVVAVFAILGMYRYIPEAISSLEISRMFVACIIDIIAELCAARILRIRLSVSMWFMMMVFKTIGAILVRYSVRIFDSIAEAVDDRDRGAVNRIMLVGAGSAGNLIMREIKSNGSKLGKVVCVIDDDPAKAGKTFYGVKIEGGRDEIIKSARRYKVDEIFIVMPSATREDRRAIVEICNKTGCRTKTLPGMYQIMSDEISVSSLRDISIQDLLGREQVTLDMSGISDFLKGKTVLVTGAGGSIGSELCRQIAKYSPKVLIGLDIYENTLYDIQQELKLTYRDTLDFRAEIASIRDKERIYELFEEYRPQIIFHAAAHKHVPLMENAPEEAIKNNVFGTYHVVRAAEKYAAEKFIMISTDKAVNPTNIMGATKRFCEMVLQSRKESETEFACVRFGNVLGSNGSVVPLFKRQIEAGGPVTITDKHIIRYFMTIPEACSLVLEAGAMAHQGQVFVLDMGNPVRILDLAEEMIRLSGLRPYVDIEIKEIGLRPGEKLYEELLMSSADLTETPNKKIFVEEQELLPKEHIMECLERLDKALSDGYSSEQLIALMKEIVPTYSSPEEVNEKVK